MPKCSIHINRRIFRLLPLSKEVAKEDAECIMQELKDPRKALSAYLSTADGMFSWGETMDDEHVACTGKNASQDPAENSFDGLTQQIQTFGHVLGSHASSVGHARFSGDFCLE